MPRRQNASAKQRKEQLQAKRAIKRGDIVSQPVKPSKKDNLSSKAVTAQRLQSTFVALSPAFLEQSKIVASEAPLLRPIPDHAAVWSPSSGRLSPTRESELGEKLECLRRPKWRYDMSKKEVEHNEEGLFKKWLAQTDSTVQEWISLSEEERQQRHQETTPHTLNEMPFSPTVFERNLEVWRQLWRVLELSDVILVLLDCRCPLVHFPSSLQRLMTANKSPFILVLTKVDVVGNDRAQAWQQHLSKLFPGVRVVMVESYAPVFTEEGKLDKTKKRTRFRPSIPPNFRQRLVSTLSELHREMLTPPPEVKDNPKRAATWKPRVKRDVDWEAVLSANFETSNVVNVASEKVDEDGSDADFFTIGLIGQPNVGKSSMLNALFGTTKVRASKTPGKTKHFQTLYWTPQVRLVDCPGLVLPSLTPLELQVLSGVLSIARMPAILLCISYACQLLPLEQILGLVYPATQAPSKVEDKRTWREGVVRQTPEKSTAWTAMDILTAHAERKGWVTAKAGRPDVNRAGNSILRSLAENKIRWGFWPPGSDIADPEVRGDGLWIPGLNDNTSDTDSEDEDGPSLGMSPSHSESEVSSQASVDDSAAETESPGKLMGGRYAILGGVGGSTSEGDEVSVAI